MNDYSASDMRCGDLTTEELKKRYRLTDILTRANPYTLKKLTPFKQPQSMFYGSRGSGKKITRQKCATILFDEFRDLSRAFSVWGPYRHLIEEMITHMQTGKGAPFRNLTLNSALKEQVIHISQ